MLAKHKENHVYCALKIPRPGFNLDDFQRLFKAETTSMIGLDHPNIVKLIESGEDTLELKGK